MEKIVVFGGSFDPIHMGHLILAQTCCEELKSKVVFLPTGKPPHKNIFTHATHRLNMLKLAISGNKSFQICSYEIKKKETSYTYETLRYLKKTLNKEIYFFVGEDSIKEIHTWHAPELILKFCTLVYAKRVGYNFHGERYLKARGLDYGKVKEIKTPLIEISSSTIRNRVNQGLSIKYLVPPPVEEYIRTHKLYK